MSYRADPETATATLVHIMAEAATDWDNRSAYAGPEAESRKRYDMVCAELDAVCRYAERLHALVRWFDLAYGDNEPVWLRENAYGHPLSENQELQDTYWGVIGHKT
jgi:hypothetical protein